MSNFLYLVHRLPYPPDRGDRIRSWQLLRFLAERADVDLACLADEPVSAQQRSTLERLCRRVAIAPVGRFRRWWHAAKSMSLGGSASEGLFYSPQLARTVSEWVSETRYDRVVAFCSSMQSYLRLPALAGVPKLVDFVDVDSQKWFDYAATASAAKRLLFRLEGRRVRELEAAIARQAEAVLVVSEPEADLLRRFVPHGKVHAIANGVDLDYFQSGARTPLPRAGEPSAVFVGALDYRANVDGVCWFCREVWPHVRERFPAAELMLVGRNPVAAVRALASWPGVELVGQVPDVRPYLAAATLAVAPLRVARGIQNKVLEAAAMGTPIIASTGALEGLDLVPEEHVLQADTPEDWLAAMTRLFHDSHECARLAASAKTFVEQNHAWPARLAPLAGLLGLPTDATGPGYATHDAQALTIAGASISA